MYDKCMDFQFNKDICGSVAAEVDTILAQRREKVGFQSRANSWDSALDIDDLMDEVEHRS